MRFVSLTASFYGPAPKPRCSSARGEASVRKPECGNPRSRLFPFPIPYSPFPALKPYQTRSSGTWYFGSAYGSSPAGAFGSTFNATACGKIASAPASTSALTSR
jgi:hypothetical protein